MEKPFLIVGLGNPGKKYEDTRHNIGFRIVKTFAAKYGISFRPSLIRSKGAIAKGKVGENDIYLLLPMTFMNESGLAVRKSIDYYKIPLNQLLVVTDDVAIPFGSVRFRMKGSCGGHNGLKSIENHLKTIEYPRMRIGVGEDREYGELSDYVLDAFTQEEQMQLPKIIDKAIWGIELWLVEGAVSTMQKINT